MNERFCQSCGMPMPTDDLLGTNEDNSKNEDYCAYCYAKGAFTQDVTMEEMIDICLEHLDEFTAEAASEATPEDLEKMKSKDGAREMMLEYFPQLKRWKSND